MHTIFVGLLLSTLKIFHFFLTGGGGGGALSSSLL